MKQVLECIYCIGLIVHACFKGNLCKTEKEET